MQPIQKMNEETTIILLLGDFTEAQRLWRRIAPIPYRGLIDAPAFPTRADVPDDLAGFWFVLFDQRFGYRNRGYVQQPAVRKARDDSEAAFILLLLGLTDSMLSGKLELSEWQLTFVRYLKSFALLMTALGKGAASQIGADDLKARAAHVERQSDALVLFALQIEHDIAGTAEVIRRRVGLYGRDAAHIEDEARQRAHIAAGFDEEINVLGFAEHCESKTPGANPPGCLDLTDLGWVSIGQLPSPGGRICRFNCKCRLEFRRSLIEAPS